MKIYTYVLRCQQYKKKEGGGKKKGTERVYNVRLGVHINNKRR